MGFHRVVGDAIFIAGKGLLGLDEFLVAIGFDGLELVPGREVADQRFGIETGKFLFADREGDDRNVLCRDALVAEFLVEGKVGVAIDGGNDGGLLALRTEIFDVGHNRLPVGMAERRLIDHDVRVGNVLGLEIGLEDLVGRVRIDIVGSGEHSALDLLVVEQVVDGRSGLLVGRGAGVEDVALAFLALILNRVEQNAVQFGKHRQYRLAAGRGPFAEHCRDFVHVEKIAGFFRRIVASRRWGLRRPPQVACRAGRPFVLLLDEHQHDVFQRRLGNRHRARERMQDAHVATIVRPIDRMVLVRRFVSCLRKKYLHRSESRRNLSNRRDPLLDRDMLLIFRRYFIGVSGRLSWSIRLHKRN